MAELLTARDVAERLARVGARLQADPEQVLAALEQLATTTPAQSHDPEGTLNEHDEAMLREAGSLGHTMPPLAERASTRTALRTAQLLEDALTVQQVADLLGVSTGRIRQRLSKRTLLGIEVGATWKLPSFQFTADGELRGLDRVLPALPHDVHPLVVWRFLTSPHADLLLEGAPVSPRTWLNTGGSVAPAVDLAIGLHSLL